MLMVGALSPWDIKNQKEKIDATIRQSVKTEQEFELCWKGINDKTFMVWGIGREDGVIGYVITTISQQGPVRGFLIYAIASWGHLADEEWKQGFSMLLESAKSVKCDQVIAWTTNPEIVRVVTALGWTVTQQCSFKIDYSKPADQTAAPPQVNAPDGPKVTMPS